MELFVAVKVGSGGGVAESSWLTAVGVDEAETPRSQIGGVGVSRIST
jgi:hypothetical protein